MGVEFDLLGDVIPEARGKAGRTGHVVTKENVSKIRLLLAAGWSVLEIARELRISAPTLRKHYLSDRPIKELRARALREARGQQMLRLNARAAEGHVAAIRALDKLLAAHDLAFVAEEYRDPAAKSADTRGGKVARPKPAKAEKPGKKEQAVIDAAAPDELWDHLPTLEGPKH